MQVNSKIKRILLHPGQFHVSTRPEVISTLLGSCIAACLYDKESGVAGMNHFLLAQRRLPHQEPLLNSEAGRYGMYAMELLINALLRRGARRTRLKAKIFGGANVLADSLGKQASVFNIGQVNIDFIHQYLQNEQIPLVTEDVGGQQGRVIHFVTRDQSIYLRRMGARDKWRVERQEQAYWQQKLAEQALAEKQSQVDFW
ncbi:chemotaxis protein CheD [Allopseudospirillum japonicum]|uniref:Probable chemoreceptor glutamine deamidase CheD n=1 Tax=Allopseudospirillum japonicum TaxID=64971 RepID=A0A1H6T835_9GAMM|nr:chemotaxis protein CheD [Allopseudospirillum japonicum]SEI76229.1 chemotaxis protein CheD [Allopseudospirillum japonicum]